MWPLLLLVGCQSEQPADAMVGQIVEDISRQRFAHATTRYRRNEALVLASPAAAAWRRALQHDDATVRQWAIDALSRIGESEDVEQLVACLDDPYRKVSEAAAEGLVRLDPRTAQEVFVDRLESAGAEDVIIAARGLAALGATESLPQLIARLRDGDMPSGVRSAVAQALGELGDVGAATALTAVAVEPNLDLQLRRQAGEALAILEGEEALAGLHQLRDCDDPYLQELAEQMLGL